ncbi:AAA family ATPase [Treponema parvum]|uniref:Replication-associated recombination protein A n=1 Tax=Treponema parvum TaxID=138851 RepID=A0A975F0T1_9SPIR|nr:AAA family ATPase [Treponema parvum]QTQ12262.1 AAA family ATPase [Treponema parvum]
MSDLFDSAKKSKEPLASRMRPRNLDEYIGQDHIVGKGRLLRRAIAADQLSSVIFYGPPGSGKTTLARVIANHTKSNFITLNAVLTGVQDIRVAIKQAEEYYRLYNRRTILFVDEVHRWNKSQQDALLPWVENGTIILVGATTENPFFEVNKALVSRSRVFQLKPLTKEDLTHAAKMALEDAERGYGHWKIQFEQGALEHLIDTANGDARSLLNALELAVETTPEKWQPEADPPVPAWGSTIYISKEAAEESIQKKVVLYDRDGDYHYDIISAFIKSLRGRDPDGAMYWLARMVRAGEDPAFIFRRMLISACEDTGLADPNAITVVVSSAEAFDRVGLPEGRYHLAHAALYLATAPKSNSSMAFFDALASVEKDGAEIPNHLKDPSRDEEGFGHGKGYLYPHAYRDHWVAQQYLPDALVGRIFYTPSDQGYEKIIKNDVLSRRELQIASILGTSNAQNAPAADAHTESASDHSGRKSGGEKEKLFKADLNEWWISGQPKNVRSKSEENLTYTPPDSHKETALDKADMAWRQRLDSNRAENLLGIRDTMTSLADLSRHHRCLIWDADDGLLLWEIARKTPEGVTCGVCRNKKGKEILEQYARTLDNLDKPVLEYRPETDPRDPIDPKAFKDIFLRFQYNGAIFDRVFFRDPFTSVKAIKSLADSLKALLSGSSDATASLNAPDALNSPPNASSGGEKTESPLAPMWKAIVAQRIPCSSQHIGKLVERQVLTSSGAESFREILTKMEKAETEFFSDKENPLFNWNAGTVSQIFGERGFRVTSDSRIISEKRRVSQQEIQSWFNAENSAYGSYISNAIGKVEADKIKNLLETAAKTTIFNWETETAFFTISSDQ